MNARPQSYSLYDSTSVTFPCHLSERARACTDLRAAAPCSLAALISRSLQLDSTLRHLQDGVTYEDGCHVWLCVPELGWVEYHPFSVASTAAHPAWRDRMLLHVKVYDRWTSVRTISSTSPPRLLVKHQVAVSPRSSASEQFLGFVGNAVCMTVSDMFASAVNP